MNKINDKFSLAKLFSNSIDDQLQLEKQKKFYLLTEDKNGTLYKFKSPSKLTAGFKIDKLGLFKGSSLKHINKMCDVLFVIKHKGKDFIITIEIKRKHKSQYKKQLQNAYRFSEYLVNLLQDHGHYTGKPHYLNLLIREEIPKHEQKNLTSPGSKIKHKNINSKRYYFQFGKMHHLHGVLAEELKHLSKTA